MSHDLQYWLFMISSLYSKHFLSSHFQIYFHTVNSENTHFLNHNEHIVKQTVYLTVNI